LKTSTNWKPSKTLVSHPRSDVTEEIFDPRSPPPTQAQLAVKKRFAVSDEQLVSMVGLGDLLASRCPSGYFMWGSERIESSRMTYFIYLPTNPRGIYWLDG